MGGAADACRTATTACTCGCCHPRLRQPSRCQGHLQHALVVALLLQRAAVVRLYLLLQPHSVRAGGSGGGRGRGTAVSERARERASRG